MNKAAMIAAPIIARPNKEPTVAPISAEETRHNCQLQSAAKPLPGPSAQAVTYFVAARLTQLNVK